MKKFPLAAIALSAALFLPSVLPAAAADYSFAKWTEQFSRWKLRPQQGAYDKMIQGGPGGATLISMPYGGGNIRSFDGGLTWQPFSINGQWAYDVAMSPTDARIWYAYPFLGQLLHRTSDSGTTWTPVGAPLAAGFQPAFVTASATPDVIYRTLYEIDRNSDFGPAMAKYGTLQRSIDGGATWVDIAPPLDFRRAFPSPADAGLLYGLGNSGLHRSRDQGATWTPVVTPGGTLSLASGLALDRFDPDIAYLMPNTVDLNGVLHSTRDGGATWTSKPMPGGRLFVDGKQKGRAYLFSTFYGAYETRDAGITWVNVEPKTYTSANSNVSGVAFQNSRRVAVGPYFNSIHELDLEDGALALASDLWWSPGESGWGLSITHRASTQTFVTWYTYDTDGRAVWRAVSGGKWSDRTFSGDLYEMTGPRFFGSAFDASAVIRRKVGIVQIAFDSEDRAAFSYQLASGESGNKRIERQRFAAPLVTPTVPESYADLWWNAAESGWGVAINHQGDNIFAAWFAYADDGRPLWLVMPDAKVVVTGGIPVAAGDVYTTRGPSSSAPFDPALVALTKMGTASLAFRKADEAVLTSTLFGRTENRTLSRLPF